MVRVQIGGYDVSVVICLETCRLFIMLCYWSKDWHINIEKRKAGQHESMGSSFATLLKWDFLSERKPHLSGGDPRGIKKRSKES